MQWSEAKVRSEITGVLHLLAEMHNVGITHRDLTPGNVFLRDGHLALGDFGISRMSLNPREATVTPYTPAYVPRSMESRYLWGPAEDLYQIGLLTCTLLTGKDWDTHRINALRDLKAKDDLKCWIWHVTSEKTRRYHSAGAALEALQTLKNVRLDNGRMPASLQDERVVLTGSLETLTRSEATDLLRRAGATVQHAVADTTTLVVRGTVRNGLNYDVGRKLYATRERKRLGQRITVVSATQLERWLSRK